MAVQLSTRPISKEEAETFAHVGAGTLMGELLRRYWWPIGISADLKDKPTFIRLLCEDLVLFRDGEGRTGLLAAQCSHRGVNLCFGNSEVFGLRCRYHGWLYDIHGNVLDTPGEADESFKETFKHPAYPAEELGGLIWAYLGPEPAPLLPRFQFLVEGTRNVSIGQFENHNWLNGEENGMDPIHVTFLHGEVWPWVSAVPDDTRFELVGDQDGNPWGIVYKAHRPDAQVGDRGTFRTGHQLEDFRLHALLMPGISRTMVSPSGLDYPVMVGGRWSVPIDDDHTMHVQVGNWSPKGDGKIVSTAPPSQQNRDADAVAAGPRNRTAASPAVVAEPFKEYRETRKSEPVVLGYTIPNDAGAQDATMRQSLGKLADRIERERLLPTADTGVNQLRRLYLDMARRVQEGLDPMGTVRDPAQNELIVVRGDRRWPLD